ncbi:MAG TPA: molybdate ABC transporter substrate-binding protein [Chloroflexota bacterium]|nr:molybdate ABC transporter substrate-binding protein [Chloroflexota bacterium]
MKIVRRTALMCMPLGIAACGTGGSTPTVDVRPVIGASPAATPEPKELVVLAASSLTDAFNEMADDFPRRPEAAGLRLILSFGASTQLRIQLEQGAPADIYESADDAQMQLAVRAGLMQGTPTVFARNRLVVVLPKENRAGLTTLSDLGKPGIKLVATVRDVPVGNYTYQTLAKMAADPQYGAGFDQKVLANVVSEEANVRQIVTKVQLGEADAGFVYASEISPRITPDVKTIEIPERLQAAAEHVIGVTRTARAPVTAPRFIDYVHSPAGQTILKRHGFITLA